MSNDTIGVSRNSWIAIPQAMQQHGQAKRAAPPKEAAVGDRVAVTKVVVSAATQAEQLELKLL